MAAKFIYLIFAQIMNIAEIWQAELQARSNLTEIVRKRLNAEREIMESLHSIRAFNGKKGIVNGYDVIYCMGDCFRSVNLCRT